MDLIQRPKQVQRSQKNYLSNEKYQDYAETQFKNIYDYLDKLAKEETILFDNYSNSNTTITLSESVADYTDIEVFYKASRENKTIEGSQRFYNANNNNINMHLLFRESGTRNVGSTALYSVSGKTLSLVTGSQYEFSHNTVVSANQNNNIFITKVIGIKRKE